MFQLKWLTCLWNWFDWRPIIQEISWFDFFWGFFKRTGLRNWTTWCAWVKLGRLDTLFGKFTPQSQIVEELSLLWIGSGVGELRTIRYLIFISFFLGIKPINYRSFIFWNLSQKWDKEVINHPFFGFVEILYNLVNILLKSRNDIFALTFFWSDSKKFSDKVRNTQKLQFFTFKIVVL